MDEQTIGVDPGLQGGIAVLRLGETAPVFYEIPRDSIDEEEIDVVELYKIFTGIFNSAPKTRMFIEKQHAFPGQGVVSNSRIVGEYKTIRAVALISRYMCNSIVAVMTISSRVWQAHIYPKDIDKGLGKERSVIAYKQIFGEDKVPMTGVRKKKPHLGFIDAALIAKYGSML
ncbi:MAG: hypothetical protein ABIM30_00390 [candidate division WOR-3 bacterium]